MANKKQKKKKKSWFDSLKRFFGLDALSRSEKKERRRKWAFERLQSRRKPPPLVAPSQRPSTADQAEDLQSKSALNVAMATAAAAEAAVAAAQMAAVAAAQMAAEVFKLSTRVQNLQIPKPNNHIIKPEHIINGNALAAAESPLKKIQDGEGGVRVKAAAITIQSAFRGYLARKALRALKGIVKLQAIIRGRIIRRQAMATMKRLQSIVDIHSDVCSKRSNTVERTWNYNEDCLIKQWRDKIKGERRWDDSLLSKDKEDAMVLSKKEAELKRDRIRAYSFNHRKSAESENKQPNGRWRYWLEQWVDTQLNKSKEFEDLDPIPSTNPKLKEENGVRRLHQRNYLKQQQQPPSPLRRQQYETPESPVSGGRRQLRHKRQSSMGDDKYSFPSSPSVPTYMVATESAKAKTRSLSSPKLRPGAFDTYSDSYSPYKNKLSLVSSFVSEVPSFPRTYRGAKSIYQQQRSPSLRELHCAVKSERATKEAAS